MVTTVTAPFATPGRLLAGRLEVARDRGPGKSQYQIDVRSIEPVRVSDLAEIVGVPNTAIRTPRDLVVRDDLVILDHPPLDTVWVRCGESLYGPFRTAPQPGGSLGSHRVRLETAQADHIVCVVPASALKELGRGYVGMISVEVSTDEQNVNRSLSVASCHYDLIAGSALEKLSAKAGERLHLEPYTQVVLRVAKQLFTRKKRQELQQLMEEMRQVAEGTTTYRLTDDAARVLGVVKDNLQADQQVLDQLAVALVESGTMSDRVDAAIQSEVERHIQTNAATMQAEISSRVAQVEGDLESLLRQRAGVEEELETIRRTRLAATEKEIERLRDDFEQQCDAQRSAINEQRGELQKQQLILSKNLEEVTTRLASASGEVINEFLAIAPLLPHLRHSASGPPPAAVANAEQERSVPTRQDAWAFAPYVAHERGGAEPLDEVTFFARFEEHVARRGFRHRRRDLVAFHLSVKCGDLAVLAGPPGIGKSTLPGLYHEALAGDRLAERRHAYLLVSVSPAWFDMRDFVGHVNALEREFQPSEGGAFHHVVNCVEEYRRFGTSAGMSLVCLDEMNLAQVEHYFSGFIQALDQRSPEQRTIRFFASDSVRQGSPFRPWASIQLPPTIRFVGTINADETTKALSQRLLDRANLIRLRPPPDGISLSAEDEPPQPTGPAVALSHLRQWTRDAPLDRRTAEVLDEIRPRLAMLGCALNPRRMSAIHRFIASMPASLGSQDQALDLQIAQRLVPQIRGLFRRDARRAFDELRAAIDARGPAFEETRLALEELRDLDYEDAPDGVDAETLS